MTTFARGMSAPKRGVGAYTRIARSGIDQLAITLAGREIRPAATAEAAERRAIHREHAWAHAAALAVMRMTPRA